MEWWRETKKANTHYRVTFASYSPSIDTTEIPRLVLKACTVESQKRVSKLNSLNIFDTIIGFVFIKLVDIGLKKSVRGFDGYDSDKFLIFWSKDIVTSSEKPASKMQWNQSNSSLLEDSADNVASNFIPPDLNVKEERGVKIEAFASVEKSADFDVIEAEKATPLLQSKLKNSFDNKKPDDFCVKQ